MSFFASIPRCKISGFTHYSRCNKRASHHATMHYLTETGEASAPTYVCEWHAKMLINRFELGEHRVRLGTTNVIEISKVWPIAHSLPTGRKQK